MHIEPSREQIDQLAADAETHPGPVVMINLLRYRPDGGAQSYAHYGEGVLPCLARVGARLIWQGSAHSTVIGPPSETWDAVVLVQYPSRRAFLEMITSPEYLAIAGRRSDALIDSRLIATAPD